MFGMEKNERALFEFDLEKELRQNPTKVKDLLKLVEATIQEIKGLMRQGAATIDFDRYGILLHGFAGLQRVLNRIANKKSS